MLEKLLSVVVMLVVPLTWGLGFDWIIHKLGLRRGQRKELR
jgi:hypothetical protein